MQLAKLGQGRGIDYIHWCFANPPNPHLPTLFACLYPTLQEQSQMLLRENWDRILGRLVRCSVRTSHTGTPQACYCVSKMNVLPAGCKLQSTDQGPGSPSESQVCLLRISMIEVCKGKGAGGRHIGESIGYMIKHPWLQLLILIERLAQVSLLNSLPFLLLNWYWGI